MQKNRLEAFSDGVIAIIITIMVLELKIPHGDGMDAIKHLLPKFFSYVLSFLYVAIYWNNHHHMLQTVSRVTGPVMWANTHLLFWLSLIPFVTAWAGENNFSELPIVFYAVVLFMAAIAYFILTKVIISTHGGDSVLAEAVKKDYKGKLSVILYAVAIPAVYWSAIISISIFIIVALIWLIPDKRIERKISG